MMTSHRTRSPSMKIPFPFACPLLFALAAPAGAACTRPIQVPLAPIGLSIIIDGDKISGIYPDVLVEAGKRAHCQFVFKPVPRARLEVMFENGTADLLLPAPRTARRDHYGSFTPLVQARPALITVNPKLEPVQSLAQLRTMALRIAIVRGFDYGKEYGRFVNDNSQSGRIFAEVDAAHVARLLHAGIADAAVMTPTVLAAAISSDPRLAGLTERLRIEALEELDWVDTGIYLSRSSLGEADQAELTRLLQGIAHSSALWNSYKRYYPANILNNSLRPREP